MFELGQPDPDGHPELREAELRSWTPLRDAVRAAVDAGLLQGDVDLLAHGFWAGVHGLVSLHLAGKLAHGLDIAQLARPLLSQLVVGGVAREPRIEEDRVVARQDPRLDDRWDVIVIGSGLGGLGAAARLSRTGLRVLVLEQHVFAGGYAHHFLRKVRGTKIVYDFDVALHQTGRSAPGALRAPACSPSSACCPSWSCAASTSPIAAADRGTTCRSRRTPTRTRRCSSSCYPEQARGVRDLFQTLREIDATGPDGAPSEAALAALGLSLAELIDAARPRRTHPGDLLDHLGLPRPGARRGVGVPVRANVVELPPRRLLLLQGGRTGAVRRVRARDREPSGTRPAAPRGRANRHRERTGGRSARRGTEIDSMRPS